MCVYSYKCLFFSIPKIDLKPDDCIKERGYKTILEKIDEYLKKELSDKYERKEIRPVTLEFVFKESEDEITVKLSLSPWWKKNEDLFTVLEGIDSHEIRELYVVVNNILILLIINILCSNTCTQ